GGWAGRGRDRACGLDADRAERLSGCDRLRLSGRRRRHDPAQRVRHALAPRHAFGQGRTDVLDLPRGCARRARSPEVNGATAWRGALLLALLVLQACAVDPLRARRAAATAAAAQDRSTTRSAADACAAPPPDLDRARRAVA